MCLHLCLHRVRTLSEEKTSRDCVINRTTRGLRAHEETLGDVLHNW